MPHERMTLTPPPPTIHSSAIPFTYRFASPRSTKAHVKTIMADNEEDLVDYDEEEVR
jgi:hypothetical protein